MLMSKLLIAGLATSFLMFPYCANAGDTDSPAAKWQREYRIAKEKCNTMRAIERDQCLTDARDKYDRSQMRCEGMKPQDKLTCLNDGQTQSKPQCEKLTDRNKRDCMLETLMWEHDRMRSQGRVSTGGGGQ